VGGPNLLTRLAISRLRLVSCAEQPKTQSRRSLGKFLVHVLTM